MNLINISPNIFINPKCISCIEQKVINKKTVIIVWVEGKSYTLQMPLEQFFTILDNLDVTSNVQTKQEFGG